MPLLDVSLCLSPDIPTYPGNPPFELQPVKRVALGDSSNVSALSLGTHTGTHVDAPRHFFPNGPGVDQLPLDVLVGPARLLDFRGVPAITARHLQDIDLRGATRVLLRTDNSAAWASRGSSFNPGFVYLTDEGARLLVERDVRLVGIDYLSIEQFKAPGAPTHHELLGRGVIVIEGLDLSAAEAGDYELFCLPLKVADADGAPARVLLRR